MSQCPNCNRPLSCGCQIRHATDGKQCCDACVQVYNVTIQRIAEQKALQSMSMQPESRPNEYLYRNG